MFYSYQDRQPPIVVCKRNGAAPRYNIGKILIAAKRQKAGHPTVIETDTLLFIVRRSARRLLILVPALQKPFYYRFHLLLSIGFGEIADKSLICGIGLSSVLFCLRQYRFDDAHR